MGIKCVRMCVSLSTLLLLILKLGPDWCQGSRIFVRLACHLLSGKSAIYSVQQADKHISDMLTCISRRVHGHLHKSKHKQKETRILKAYNASPPPLQKKPKRWVCRYRASSLQRFCLCSVWVVYTLRKSVPDFLRGNAGPLHVDSLVSDSHCFALKQLEMRKML